MFDLIVITLKKFMPAMRNGWLFTPWRCLHTVRWKICNDTPWIYFTHSETDKVLHNRYPISFVKVLTPITHHDSSSLKFNGQQQMTKLKTETPVFLSALLTARKKTHWLGKTLQGNSEKSQDILDIKYEKRIVTPQHWFLVSGGTCC